MATLAAAFSPFCMSNVFVFQANREASTDNVDWMSPTGKQTLSGGKYSETNSDDLFLKTGHNPLKWRKNKEKLSIDLLEQLKL